MKVLENHITTIYFNLCCISVIVRISNLLLKNQIRKMQKTLQIAVPYFSSFAYITKITGVVSPKKNVYPTQRVLNGL